MAAFKCLEIYTELQEKGDSVQAVVQLANLGALRSSAKPSQARPEEEEEGVGEERFIYVDLMAVSGLYACSSLSPSRGVSCLCRRTRAICAALTRQRGGKGQGKGVGAGVQVKRTVLSAFGHLKCV